MVLCEKQRQTILYDDKKMIKSKKVQKRSLLANRKRKRERQLQIDRGTGVFSSQQYLDGQHPSALDYMQ